MTSTNPETFHLVPRGAEHGAAPEAFLRGSMVIQTRPFHVDFIQVDPVERPLKPVIEAFAPKLDALRTLVQESPEVIEHNELTYVVVIYPFKEYRSL